MEIEEVRERLAKAEVHRDTLDKQFAISQAETKKLQLLAIKWEGVADYFRSLLPDPKKPEPGLQGATPFVLIGMQKGTQN